MMTIYNNFSPPNFFKAKSTCQSGYFIFLGTVLSFYFIVEWHPWDDGDTTSWQRWGYRWRDRESRPTAGGRRAGTASSHLDLNACVPACLARALPTVYLISHWRPNNCLGSSLCKIEPNLKTVLINSFEMKLGRQGKTIYILKNYLNNVHFFKKSWEMKLRLVYMTRNKEQKMGTTDLMSSWKVVKYTKVNGLFRTVL